MSSLSASSFRLLEAFKSSLRPGQFLQTVQDHGIILIGVIFGLIVLYAARYITSPYRKVPPGPRGYPIIGNLLEMSGGLAGQWLKYAGWHKKYGDLTYLNVAGQPVVIINSRKVAADLLDRRSAKYSDRPRNAVIDIMTRELFFVFTENGDTWRRMRNTANEGFSKSAVKGFYETQNTEAVVLASELLVHPTQWDRHFRHAPASVTLSILYGYPTFKSDMDPIVVAINDFAERIFKAGSTGNYLVHFFPWLRYFPSSLAKWKRDAEAWYKQDTAMFERLFQTAEENVAKGEDDKSVAATLIREREKNKLSPIERVWYGGTMYFGGADTTSVTLAWWLLAMLAYPETQARAHAELDAVVGRARPPTFADRPHLPYVHAMVKEALRWRPAGPLGAPHQSTADDMYEGMYIPKGTICIANVMHMNRDPVLFGKNTDDFDPSRHLDGSGYLGSGVSDSTLKEHGHFTYGFGRRNCVGRYMADNSLFIDMAVMLWATKFERKKDASGRFLPLNLEGWVDVGLVVRPIPFEAEITPRFPEAPAMLAQERELRGL